MIHFREWFCTNHRDVWAEINWPTEVPPRQESYPRTGRHMGWAHLPGAVR